MAGEKARLAPWEKARLDIVMWSPWLARAVYSLPLMARASVPVAATDGARVYIGPRAGDYAAYAPGILVHEYLHVLLAHHVRAAGREARRWNVACDLAINPLVEAAGYVLPPDALIDARYAGQSAEEIYARLPSSPPSVSWGGVTPSLDPDAATKAEALAAGTMWGAVPADIARIIAPGGKPASLGERLRGTIARTVADDSSWLRPSRRVAGLPGREREGCHLAAVIDTSGSIPPDALAEALDSLLSCVDVGQLDVALADTQVHAVALDADAVGVTALLARCGGGGGTDFRPGLAWAAGQGADICVVFTRDAAGEMPPEAPDIAVVWITDGSPPFGSMVKWRDR
jgi:predicted metal-dependent peptidase